MQVSVLGRVHPCRLGKMANFLRGSALFLALGAFVLGPKVANAQELDAGESMGVYRTIDAWVRGWEIDESFDPSTLPPLACVSITLRLDGRVVGRGQAIDADGDAETIVQATRGAMSEARAWVRSRFDLEPSDEFWETTASRLTLSVELADQLVPMGEADLGIPGLGLSPGVHGLVMALGEQLDMMSPDEMISLGYGSSGGLGIEQAAYAMATALSGDGAMALASTGELLGRGYRFSRFEPVWIAQQGGGKGAVFLDRGGRIVEDSGVGVRSVREMGERIAGYLVAQQYPGSEPFGMVGSRDVVSGRAYPEIAPVYEQGLVAAALLRFSTLGEGGVYGQSEEEALRLLRDLANVHPGEPEPWDTDLDGGIGSAACTIALSYVDPPVIGIDPGLVELETRCRGALNGVFSPIAGFNEQVPPGARGLIAWALVRSGSEYAERAVRMVFTDTDPSQLSGQMPFLGWAEVELAQGKDEVPASPALTEMREWMWKHQLSKSDLDWRDRDFIGSIVFTKGSGAGGLPTSGNVRPIAMVATMLGDPRLTPGTIADPSIAREISKTASAMRFIDQLTMSETSGFMSRAPERSVGGVRSSLWGWRVSPSSSAVALLAAVEFERSIRAIAARGVPEQQP